MTLVYNFPQDFTIPSKAPSHRTIHCTLKHKKRKGETWKRRGERMYIPIYNLYMRWPSETTKGMFGDGKRRKKEERWKMDSMKERWEEFLCLGVQILEEGFGRRKEERGKRRKEKKREENKKYIVNRFASLLPPSALKWKEETTKEIWLHQSHIISLLRSSPSLFS